MTALFRYEWDQIVLGDTLIPPTLELGSATCDVSCSQEIDEKKKPGKNKPKLTAQGEKGPSVKIKCDFHRDLLELMIATAKMLWPPQGPVEIIHPNAAAHGVTAVMVKSVSGFKNNGDGTFSYSWDCVGWDLSKQSCNPLLRVGTVDDEVKQWISFLNTRGYSTEAPTRTFTATTKTDTMEFQTAEQILVDGIVGPQTRGAAGKYGYVPPVHVCPPGTGGAAVGTPKAADPAEGLIQIQNALNEALGDIIAANPTTAPDAEAAP